MRSRLKQGIPAALRCIVWCVTALLPGATIACGADAPRLEAWPASPDGGLWWVRGSHGDADASNRGVVSSAAFGRALGCVVRRETGHAITDVISAATQQLAVLARNATTLMGEQGEPAPVDELKAHIVYWNALDAEVHDAQSRGDDATAVPTTLPAVDASRTMGTAHALNWQRAWRHAEDEAFKP
jgi:hypothetical protein